MIEIKLQHICECHELCPPSRWPMSGLLNFGVTSPMKKKIFIFQIKNNNNSNNNNINNNKNNMLLPFIQR